MRAVRLKAGPADRLVVCSCCVRLWMMPATRRLNCESTVYRNEACKLWDTGRRSNMPPLSSRSRRCRERDPSVLATPHRRARPPAARDHPRLSTSLTLAPEKQALVLSRPLGGGQTPLPAPGTWTSAAAACFMDVLIINALVIPNAAQRSEGPLNTLQPRPASQICDSKDSPNRHPQLGTHLVHADLRHLMPLFIGGDSL